MALKLSLCINTHNEGADLLQTIISFKNAYRGPFEAVVVADGTTDSSLDALGAAETEIQVIRNRDRLGCGKAKQQALEAATGDVIIHADGHCRMLRGMLDNMVRKAATKPYILVPGVAPLHCAPDEQFNQGDEGWYAFWDKFIEEGPTEKQRKIYERCKAAYEATGGKAGDFFDYDHTCFGGKIKLKEHAAAIGGSWLTRGWRRAAPKEPYRRKSATWYAVFMASKDTFLNRLGGWNLYPGRWGSQEIGLALRAWFADVPIYAARDVVCGHRYASDRYRKRDKSWYYPIRTSEERANTYYSHMVVFDPETVDKVWKPLWKKHAHSNGAWVLLEKSDLQKQSEEFRQKLKRRSDREFFETFGWPKGAKEALGPVAIPVAKTPPDRLPPDEITAIILNYKRPRNTQLCVDAIRRYGIKNIWVWCQENAEPPKGVTRVFTDNQNSMTWSRWCVAPLAPTPWVLFCDDDAELKEKGLDALCAGARQYPGRPIGLFGAVFDKPCCSYTRRKYYWSHEINKPQEVDMLWPKGMLLPRDVAQKIFGRADLWQRMRTECRGETRGDDLIAFVAGYLEGIPNPVVMPTQGKGVVEHHSEGKEYALCRRPSYQLKRKTMPIWWQMGYRGLKARHKVEALSSSTFEQRVETFLQEIGGKVKQHQKEAAELYRKIAAVKPKIFVEVGSEYGGTLYLYAGACAPRAQIIAIDEGTRYPARKYLKRTIERLQEEGYNALWIRGDSHDPEVIAKLKALLGKVKIDVLHIDGDHSEKGVRQDWENYGSLVRSGGFVAFHDIKHTTGSAKVWKFWEQLTKEIDQYDEIVRGRCLWHGDTDVTGIGVVYKE